MGTIRKLTKSWWIDYRIDGKRFRKRIGHSKQIAQLALSDIEVKIAKKRAGFFISDKKISDYIPQFLSYVRVHVKPSTAKRYDQIISHLSHFLGTLEDPPIKLSQITPPVIEQYKLYRLGFVKPQTVNYELTCLHHFFRYAVEMKYIQSNPTQQIKKIRKPQRKAPRFLTKEEILSLLSKCSPGLSDIVKVLLNTGMRWGELRNLEWNDIDWNEKVIHIRIKEDWSPKGGERKVPMNNAVISILKSILAKTPTQWNKNVPNGNNYFAKRLKTGTKRNRWVFTTKTGSQVRQQGTWSAFKLACRRAGIENATLHSLRHTFASHLVMAGVDLTTVSKLLGHKDISTTMIYSHLSPEHLRGAVEKLNL